MIAFIDGRRGHYGVEPICNGGMDVSEARRLKALVGENARLKKLPADSMVDNAVLIDLLGIKTVAPAAERDAVAIMLAIAWMTPAEYADTFNPRRDLPLRSMTNSAPYPVAHPGQIAKPTARLTSRWIEFGGNVKLCVWQVLDLSRRQPCLKTPQRLHLFPWPTKAAQHSQLARTAVFGCPRRHSCLGKSAASLLLERSGFCTVQDRDG